MALIIATESPFRRMPVDMPRRQILYIDALRLSTEMAGVAFDRLHNLLTGITEYKHDLLTGVTEQQNDLLGYKAVPAILDAYAIIDSVHRFRELLQVTPGLKHNSAFQLFMHQTNEVRELRNIVQHLNREVDRIAQEGWAALGTLTWLGPSAVPNGPPSSFILQAGTSYPGQWTHGPMIDTHSSLLRGEIADISLVTAGIKVNLSAIMDKLRSFIRSLEGPLEEFAADKERFGSDVLMTLSLTPVEETASNGDPDGT